MTTARGLGKFLVVGLLSVLSAVSVSRGSSEADRIAEVLALQPGHIVADIGAGDGQWSIELARRVGSEGHVYANEIDQSEIRKIDKAIERSRLRNITSVSGSVHRTNLEDECCDAILLRVVYHHFSDSAAMRADLIRVLKPGGLIAVIDFAPPKNGRHGIQAQEAIDEMRASGFQLIEHQEKWTGGRRYQLLFRKASLQSRIPDRF